MEEKGQIKISLGIVILLFIIMILIMSLIGVWYYYSKNYEYSTREENKSSKLEENVKNNVQDNSTQMGDIKNEIDEEKNKQEENIKSYKTLSIDTATKKIVDDDVESYYIEAGEIFGISLSVSEGKAYVSSSTATNWVEYGIVSNEKDVKLPTGRSVEITGFDKKIIDAKISCYGQSIGGVFAVFLMDDGTLEYSSIQNIVKNLTTEGKVENISSIQRLYACDTMWKDGGGQSSIIALDIENNMYDIGYTLNRMGKIVDNGVS